MNGNNNINNIRRASSLINSDEIPIPNSHDFNINYTARFNYFTVATLGSNASKKIESIAQGLSIGSEVENFIKYNLTNLKAKNGIGFLKIINQIEETETSIIGTNPILNEKGKKIVAIAEDDAILNIERPDFQLILAGQDLEINVSKKKIKMLFRGSGMIKFRSQSFTHASHATALQNPLSDIRWSLYIKKNKAGMWTKEKSFGLINVPHLENPTHTISYNNQLTEFTATIDITDLKGEGTARASKELTQSYLSTSGTAETKGSINNKKCHAKASGKLAHALINEECAGSSSRSNAMVKIDSDNEIEVRGRKSTAAYIVASNELFGQNKGRGEINILVEDEEDTILTNTGIFGSSQKQTLEN